MESSGYLGQELVSNDIRENTTFYYSNFQLFPDNSELLFASYLSFKKNLQEFLGDDWENYAKKAIYQTFEGGATIYVPTKLIFGMALEVWLELRKNFNKLEKENEEKSTKSLEEVEQEKKHFEEEKEMFDKNFQTECPNFADFEEEKNSNEGETPKSSPQDQENLEEGLRGFEVFQQKVRERYPEHLIDEPFFRAIIHGFYISAMKVFEKTLESYSISSGGTSLFEESKRFLLNKLKNIYQTKFKALKPILVATEKIKDFIYHPKSPQASILDEKDRKNMANFSTSLQNENPIQLHIPIPIYKTSNSFKLNEEQELKKSFSNLRISSGDNSTVLGKRSAFEANSTIEIKKINKKSEKLINHHMIEFAAHYVNTVTKTSSSDWQVSRSFVTNMVEVNYNRLLQMEKMHNKTNELKNEVKIRFIQPAQEFYNNLMEVWIILKTRSLSREVLFHEYLEKVKESFGNIWHERFATPTHNFFMTLYFEWHHLKQIETDSEEKILLFTKKVKENMLKSWEENVVKKVEELSQKKMTVRADR